MIIGFIIANKRMKGIIYSFIDNEYFFIGSTTNTFDSILLEHKTASEGKSKNSKFYKYIRNIRGGWDDIIIIVLETVECDTFEEVEKIKMKYIKEHISDKFCLNIIKNSSERYFISKRYIK